MSQTFAERLRNDIENNQEISRLESVFRYNPKAEVETSLSVSEASRLGFSVSSSYQGTYVSLPQHSQFN